MREAPVGNRAQGWGDLRASSNAKSCVRRQQNAWQDRNRACKIELQTPLISTILRRDRFVDQAQIGAWKKHSVMELGTQIPYDCIGTVIGERMRADNNLSWELDKKSASVL